MPTPASILAAVLPPALWAGAVLLFAWRLWRREGASRPLWAGALALGGAFAVGFFVIADAPALPAADRTLTGLDLTFWGGLGALLCGAAQGRWCASGRAPLRWVLRALAGGLLLLVLRNAAEVGVPQRALLVLAWLALAGGLDALAARGGALAPLVLWTPAAGLALVAGLSGSALLGELSGGVAGAAGAALVLAWWRPRLALARGGAETALFFLAALLLNAHYYSYTTGVDALLVAGGVAAPCALLAPPLARLGGARRAWLGFALAALPVAIAVTRAVLAFEPDPYAGYY